MDDLVVSSSPSMVAVYQDFERVLKQRNSLLKSLRSLTKQSDLSTLEAWTSKTVSLAAQIIVARTKAVTELTPFFIDEYGALAGGDVAGAQYDARGYVCEGEEGVDSVAAALEEALQGVRDDELDRGMTLVGPHRDDLQLTISRKPSRTHASQGETWSIALSLRLAMAGWLRNKRSGGDPIIMLDDVFAELDSSRRAHLVASLSGYEQILITSAVEGDIPTTLQGDVFDVREGIVTPR
jgi:DNA replication and repair protein RecF